MARARIGSFGPGCGLQGGFAGDDRGLVVSGREPRGQVGVHEPPPHVTVDHGRAQAHMLGEQVVVAEWAFRSASCGQ